MPLLRVKVDEAIVVALPTDRCNIAGARIGGTRDDEDYADLSAWGGTYGQGPKDVHCIWLDAFKLLRGQTVEVEFAASGDVVGMGKPFDSSEVSTPPPGHSHEEELRALAQELRGLPWVRGPYKFRYESTQSTPVDCLLEPFEYGFGLNVLWSDIHPERLSVSLYAYTIDSVEHQNSGRNLASEKVAIGQACRLALVA